MLNDAPRFREPDDPTEADYYAETTQWENEFFNDEMKALVSKLYSDVEQLVKKSNRDWHPRDLAEAKKTGKPLRESFLACVEEIVCEFLTPEPDPNDFEMPEREWERD